MKKKIAMLLALMVIIPLLTGLAAADGRKMKIVTTIYPIYDWIREILGDGSDTDVTLLLDKGVDLHSFQPTAQDIMKIATSDIFFYIGGESDSWVKNALTEAVNPDLQAVSLMEVLGDAVRAEELVEGMESEEEKEAEEESGEETEYDEHIWLSLRNAMALVRAITDTLSGTDPDRSAIYQANADAYIEKLTLLDTQYTEMTSQAEYRTVLFGDRFPFRYLTDDYGLTYYAAFTGCSAETEASFETIVFLARKVDELGLPAVLKIEGSQDRIARTVISATATGDQKILTLNSLQGKPDAGANYLSVMENNLAVLREALNR